MTRGRDVAVLEVADPPWGDPGWAPRGYLRVDRSDSGELVDCVAVGYPMYMLAPGAQLAKGEVRGFLWAGDDLESGQLMLRDSGGSLPGVPGASGWRAGWGPFECLRVDALLKDLTDDPVQVRFDAP